MTIEVDDSAARLPRQRLAPEDEAARRSVELELRAEFPSVPVDQVRVLVECLWSHFDGARVRDFVPVLVRKQAKEELLDHVGDGTGPGVDAPAVGGGVHDVWHDQRATDAAL
jgi:hypothetical protein